MGKYLGKWINYQSNFSKNRIIGNAFFTSANLK